MNTKSAAAILTTAFALVGCDAINTERRDILKCTQASDEAKTAEVVNLGNFARDFFDNSDGQYVVMLRDKGEVFEYKHFVSGEREKAEKFANDFCLK